MFHTPTAKTNAIHRLKIARGHLDKVLKMIDEDKYCIDVLTQTKAVRKAIENAERVLLQNHLEHCVVDHIQQGQTEKAVDEVMKVFQK